MSWGKLDDSIYKDALMLSVSARARWLHVAAIAFCRDNRLPGRMTDGEVRFLVGSQGVPRACVGELEAAGLWARDGEAMVLSTFDGYIVTSATIRQQRHRHGPRDGDGDGSETPGVTPLVTPERDTNRDAARTRAGGNPNSENLSPNTEIPEKTPSEPSQRGVRGDPDRADVLQLCERLVELNDERGARRYGITGTWKREARLLLDRDGVSLGEALAVLEWAAHDSFWGPNVLAMPTFREKYDRLRMQRDRQKPVNGSAVDSDEWMRYSSKLGGDLAPGGSA